MFFTLFLTIFVLHFTLTTPPPKTPLKAPDFVSRHQPTCSYRYNTIIIPPSLRLNTNLTHHRKPSVLAVRIPLSTQPTTTTMFTHKSSPSAGIANQRPLISSSFRPSTIHPRSPSIITGTTHNRLPFSPSNSPCSLRLTVTATQLQVLLTSPSPLACYHRPTILHRFSTNRSFRFCHADHELEQQAEQYGVLTYTNIRWSENLIIHHVRRKAPTQRRTSIFLDLVVLESITVMQCWELEICC